LSRFPVSVIFADAEIQKYSQPRMDPRIRWGDKGVGGAKSKGANGAVAVGLPHRNRSVFKQAPINQWEVKGKIRMELRIREVDKGGGGLTGTHASEAKGPFSRREEGWELGEEKETKEREKKVTLRMGKEDT
jgi:hypothetical protein